METTKEIDNVVAFFTGVMEIGALPRQGPARRGRRLALEHLDDRVLLSNHSAANVAALSPILTPPTWQAGPTPST